MDERHPRRESKVGELLKVKFSADGTYIGGFDLSLKSLVETGKGAPSPEDIKIGDWH